MQRERPAVALGELEREARAAQAAYSAARVRRRSAIVAAVRAGISYRKLGGLLGLDHSAVYQIVKRAKEPKA